MRRLNRRDSTRAVQLGFIALLVICAGQVGWWYWDQVSYTHQVRMMMLSAYQVDLITANSLIEEGMPVEQVHPLFPHLSMGEDGRPTIDVRAMDLLDDARGRRLRRYRWEAGFFLVVLLGGIWILWRAIQAAEELQRRQQNFLAAVSHEFKSPLASLRLSLESLTRREPSPERLAVLTGRMDADLTRFEGMVTNILATSRLEDGEWHLYPEAVPLGAAVSATLQDRRSRAEAQGVKLREQVAAGLQVDADPGALQSALGNLVDNAIKATAAAGGGQVSVSAEAEGAWAVIQVVDDGVGFPAEEGPRLFDKFYRPGDEMRRQGGGTGLGLYIVQALTTLSGGRVSAHSDGVGAGARFVLRWPLSAGGRGAP